MGEGEETRNGSDGSRVSEGGTSKGSFFETPSQKSASVALSANVFIMHPSITCNVTHDK